MKLAANFVPLTVLVAISGLLAAPAAADVGVVGLNTTAAKPGQRIVLHVGCGSCDRPTSFPVSLVPVGQAPLPRPCQGDALCAPEAGAPPRKSPFMYLGRTRGRLALFPGADPPGSLSQLRFQIPKVGPGRYAFVIFCTGCGHGARGSLITDPTNKLLQVEPGGGPAPQDGNGGAPILWIAAAIGIVGLVGAAWSVRRRQRQPLTSP